MNELGKLISSLLLLGAGFFAASFVGPPEVVDRLARYLQPTGQVDSNGLQPLPPVTTAGQTDQWPGLPEPLKARPPEVEPFARTEQGASRIAPVAARFARAAGPDHEAGPHEPDGWPSLQPPARQPTRIESPAPQADPWLTSASLANDSPSVSSRAVAPIPRGGQRAVRAEPQPKTQPTLDQMNEPVIAPRPDSTAPASPAEAAGWPALRPPNRTDPTRTTTLRPTLGDSPYGDRPRFGSTADAASMDHNPLRYETTYPTTEAIPRREVAPRHGQHIVTDGDTLALLAERYLGDSGRARELFEFNADRLEEPDVLPIGLVLRTPAEPRRLPRPAPRTPVEDFPSLEPSGGFASLAASDARRSLTRDPFPIERRPLTSAAADPESVRPVDRPTDPLYDHEVMWDPGQW